MFQQCYITLLSLLVLQELVTVLFIYKLFKVNNKKITRILLKIMVAFFAPYIHNEFKKIMLTYKKGMSTFKKITIMSFKVYV